MALNITVDKNSHNHLAVTVPALRLKFSTSEDCTLWPQDQRQLLSVFANKVLEYSLLAIYLHIVYGCFLATRLAKKFVQGCSIRCYKKPERTFWPTQYSSRVEQLGQRLYELRSLKYLRCNHLQKKLPTTVID